VFTGLVADLGTVAAVEQTGAGVRLAIGSPLARELSVGDSVAVNGVCLTATTVDDATFAADVMGETLRRSSLGAVREGGPVNLELPLRAADRLGGHFVQGHVDGVEAILRRTTDREGVRLEVSLSPELAPFVASKGSIAVDGVSLTVVDAADGRFSFTLVPYTMRHTTLGNKAVGDRVNIEVDVLAKYVARMLGAMLPQRRRLDETFLAEHGFAG